MMKQRKYFEIYASVGRKCVPDKDMPYKVGTLLSDMKYARIHGAAIVSNTAENFSFIYGNQEAISLAKGNERLVSIAAVPTTALIESGDSKYYDYLLDQGVRAFKVLHQEKYYPSLDPGSMSAIAETLITHKRPLMIAGISSKEIYHQVGQLAGAYPELPIIMQGTSWYYGRSFLDVMERYTNLHFEISSNHMNSILEVTRKHFGIERVLFGTEWPNKSMGALKCLVEYADLTEEEKDLVAHGNACRLLGLSMDDFQLYDDTECEFDEIARQADAGLSISVPVIDSHTHMVAKEDKTTHYVMPDSDCDAIAEKMERLGIDTIITAPWSGISFDGRKGNADALYAAQKYPGKFLAYSTCNIHYDEDLKVWQKYHTEYPDIFVGIKPYWPFQKFNLMTEACEEWFAYANEHHLLLLLHTGGSDAILDQADQLSLKYPNITLILAHSGINYSVARKNAALARKRDNVVLEITYTSVMRGMIEFLVSEVGADKVLYGSDMPMRDPAPQLGWVCYAKIPLEDKKKLLAGNIQRLLKNCIT